MFAYGIFKVVYSPFKAFKEIIEKPKYAGPILILILFVLANTGFSYILLSKSYFDQMIPTSSELDEWTENCTLWTSNVGTPRSSPDHISGALYGNKSIEFYVINESQIWMRLNITDSLNCSGPEGYKNLSIRMKWNCTDKVKPENATIYLLSTPSDYVYYNLTENFAESNENIWNNLTVPLGPEDAKWAINGDAAWDNINGLSLEFKWFSSSNITLLIDGLFFHGVFKPLIETSSGYIYNYVLIGFMQFTIQWAVLGGLLYIISKMFGAKVAWKTLLTIAGFALITLFVQTVADTAAYATLPVIRYPLEMLGGVPGEGQTAYDQILEATKQVSQITNYIQMATHVWTIFLCAIALRLLFEFSWTKSILISALAYLLSVLAMSLIMNL
jgi:hypothetical protein